MIPDRPLRIIHCFRSPVGGVFRHVRDLIDEHIQAGHEVGILCDSSTGGAYEEQLFQDLEPHLALGLIRFPINRSIRPSDLLALYRSYLHIKELKPDVLHGHSAKGGAIARVIGTILRAAKQPVARLYSPHGGSLHFEKTSLKGRTLFLLERLLERFTDALCFVCDYERQTYFEKIGRPLPLHRTIYNGLRASEFEPVPLVENPSDFLYIGMMRDLKGPQHFIDALYFTAQKTKTKLSAHMVGDGPDKDRYLAKIQALGLADQITLHDAMPARQAFAMARTVIIPSLAEAMPYIVLEAAAAGKEIIASRVGGIPEILGPNHQNLVAPGDGHGLAAAMEQCLKHANRGTILDVEELRQKFSSEAMGRNMLELYRHLLK